MITDIIQTAVSIAALGLSIWAILISKKNDKQLRKQADFEKKYIVLQVLEDFLIKPTEYLYTEEYQQRLSDVRNLVRTHFEKELEQRILHALCDIYFNMKEHNDLQGMKLIVLPLVEDIIEDIKLVK